MQSQTHLAHRVALTLVLVFSLLSFTSGPALAAQRLSAKSNSPFPPAISNLISQDLVETASFWHKPLLSSVAVNNTLQAGVDFAPDYTAHAQPGEVLMFTHTLTNTGDTGDTFYLTISGWGSLNNGEYVAIPSGSTFPVEVQIAVPGDAISGTTNTTIITATSTVDPSGTTFAVVRDTITVYAPDEPPPLFEITLYDLHKGEISSRYVITNMSTADATTLHSFFDSNGTSSGELVDTLQAGQSRIYDLATLGFIPDGYIGYAIIQADWPISGTVLPDEGPCSRPLTEVSLIGPSEGSTRIAYNFTAVIIPTDATLPITYTWTPDPGSGQGTSIATYQWAMPGIYTITLSAENCGGAATATHTVTIADNPFECSTVTETLQTECEALVALYESTNGDNWYNNNGWLATNTPCSWYGVTCSEGHINRLTLVSNGLNGSLPAAIGNLTALWGLGLSNNQLSGALPPEIGNLTALAQIFLENNQLSGPIPPEIGNLTALTVLAMQHNQLSGSIPSEIGNLTTLEHMYLNQNRLSGLIPPEIGNLIALRQLDLWMNFELSGPIPPEIGNLITLTELALSDNQLSGSIPSEIGNLTALQSLSLGGNQLSGSIPSEIGSLTALTTLGLSHNQLDGPIPPEIGNLIALQSLSLDSNQLSGPIPPEIGNLTALQWWLNLRDNQLSGPIPPELGNLTALMQLYIDNNQFSGELPTSLTPLTNLNQFAFYNTDFCVPPTGNVPVWLSGIPNLWGTGIICGQGLGSLSGTVTMLDTMNLSGTIVTPNQIPVAGALVNLYRSLPWQWQHISATQTAADGTYQFTGLGQGLDIDYRVQFVDPTFQLAPQYYNAKPHISMATVITITPGVPRTGIDEVLGWTQSPAIEAETDTGSVVYNPDGTAQITMPAPNPSDITITRAVTCAAGTPSTVTLKLSTGPQYAMTNTSGDLYQATIPAAALTGNATLSVIVTCNGETTTTIVGYITLFDPSGYITDAQTEEPVVGATVTLYNVPGWEPKTGPDDDRPNTCESNLSKPEGEPWSQPAPTGLGIIANADVTPTDPKLPYQSTTTDGYYGWDVSEGCWYVTVEAEGYEPLTSPVVGIPPEVTDLDLELTPVTTACTPLTDVGILGPLDVTSTLYINTLYTFQAIITPTDATEPVTYTWAPAPQTGQGTQQVTYCWSAPDTYTVTLTAENCGGTINATRTFVIEYKDTFTVYLPLVLRN
ncbi:MAG: hypothetical protein JXR84_11650 [Anaerolineae bacterium]|nr:hypothetical protein [Anaerolineae bacterium]